MAGAVTAAAGALVLLVTQLALGGTRALPLLWSSYGLRWGLRELGLLVLLGATLARPRLPRPAAGWAPLAAGAALACVGTALLGHSGTGRSPDPTRVLASAAHLGAAATWAGCLVVLAVALAPQLRRDAAPRESARAVLQRFGPPATVCVAVMVVTGVYLSSEVVGSVDAAISTIYGRTLLLKVALAAVAGALALVNTVRLRRRSRRSTPRRTVLAEATAAVGVLALAAVLTSGQPAMEPQLVQSTDPGHGRARGPQGGRPAGDRVDPPEPARAQHRPGRRVRHASTGPLAGAGGGRVAEPAGRSERGAPAGRAARRRSLVGQHHPGGGGCRHRARRRAARRPARHHRHVRVDRGRRTGADPPGRRLHRPAGAGPARGRGGAAARAARRRRAGAGGPAPRSADPRPEEPGPAGAGHEPGAGRCRRSAVRIPSGSRRAVARASPVAAPTGDRVTTRSRPRWAPRAPGRPAAGRSRRPRRPPPGRRARHRGSARCPAGRRRSARASR